MCLSIISVLSVSSVLNYNGFPSKIPVSIRIVAVSVNQSPIKSSLNMKFYKRIGGRMVSGMLWLWLSALPFQVVSLWPQDGCSSSKYHVLAHWLLRGRRRNSSFSDIPYMKRKPSLWSSAVHSLHCSLTRIATQALASPIWLGTWKCSDWLMWTEIRFLGWWRALSQCWATQKADTLTAKKKADRMGEWIRVCAKGIWLIFYMLVPILKERQY